MNYFITYDISDDKRRTKLAKDLVRRGCKRVQYSVFFFRKPSARELGQLREAISELLDADAEKGDSVLLIPVENRETDAVEILGDSPTYRKANEDRHTWFF